MLVEHVMCVFGFIGNRAIRSVTNLLHAALLRPINNFAGSRLLHPTGGVQSGLSGLPDLT